MMRLWCCSPAPQPPTTLCPAWLSPGGAFSCLPARRRLTFLSRQAQREGADRGRSQQHNRHHGGPGDEPRHHPMFKEDHAIAGRKAGDPRCNQRGQSGLDDSEDEMTVPTGNAEHVEPMMLALIEASKAHAAAGREPESTAARTPQACGSGTLFMVGEPRASPGNLQILLVLGIL